MDAAPVMRADVTEVGAGATYVVTCRDVRGEIVPKAHLEIRHATSAPVFVVADECGSFTGVFPAPIVRLHATAVGLGSGGATLHRRLGEAARCTIVLRPDATISVKVVGPQGDSLAGALVTPTVIGFTGRQIGRTPATPEPLYTDMSGECAFEVEGNGVFSIYAEAGGSRSTGRQITVMHGRAEQVVLYVGCEYRIEGQVVDSKVGGIPAALVQAIRDPVYLGDSIRSSCTTDTAGRFSMSVPEPGWYTLLARADSHALREQVRVTVKEMGLAGSARASIVMSPCVGIAGQVVDANGYCVTGCTVVANPVGGIGEQWPDPSLDFALMSTSTRNLRTHNMAKTDRSGMFVMPVVPWRDGDWEVTGSYVDVVTSRNWYGRAVVRSDSVDASRVRLVLEEVVIHDGKCVVKIGDGASQATAYYCRRVNGVWTHQWDMVARSDAAGALTIALAGCPLTGALAIIAAESGTILEGSRLAAAYREGRASLEPRVPVVMEARDEFGTSDRLAIVGEWASYSAIVMTQSGLVVDPVIMKVSESGDYDALLVAGRYAIIARAGYRWVGSSVADVGAPAGRVIVRK
jgi:hypothetical protein